MAKANPEAMKWPTDKAKYDKNYIKTFGMDCKDCDFYEKDHVNDDGDWVKGWGCCCPIKCPYGKTRNEQQN